MLRYGNASAWLNKLLYSYMETNITTFSAKLLTPTLLALHLTIFVALMLTSTYLFGRKAGTRSGSAFLVLNRQVPWWLGGPSIAASWTWAVALMISVQMGYQHGIAGVFWFTVPNIFAVLMYVWLGPQIRKVLPEGYSLPEWMHTRFKDRRVTYLYLFVYYYYQVLAITVQVYAGSHLLAAATGVAPVLLMPTILVVTLAYGIISGLQASLITDVIQMFLIIVPGWIIAGLVTSAADGSMNFQGVSAGGGLNPFEPRFMLTTGLITSVGLISGAICDQQFWQRCLAVKESHIKRTFVFGALLFASVPLSLSLLGFVAGSSSVGLNLPADFDASLVGFAIVTHLLPAGVAVLYLYMLLAGLCSTLDSALSAASSLDALLQKKPWDGERLDKEISVSRARRSMIVISVIGLALAYGVESIPGFGLKYFWWFFNSIAACMVIPTVLSLFWGRLSAKGILIGSSLGIFAGLPLVIFSSLTANDVLLSCSYVAILCGSAVACWFTRAPASLA